MTILNSFFAVFSNRHSLVLSVCLFCLSSAAFAQPDFLFEEVDEKKSEVQASTSVQSQQPSQSGDNFDFLSESLTDEQGVNAFQFEKTPQELQSELRRQAFDAALQGILPLKPEEIRTLLEHYDRTQESVELPVYPAPRPEVSVETLSMDPGTKPTVVKVSHGYVTTLNIVDVTGAPWPIEDITWAGNFEVIEAPSEKTAHFIRISPQSEFAYGNMSIHMLGLPTPIIISLETNRDVVHYRFDAIIPKQGPMAEIPLIEEGISIAAGGGGDMAGMLSGVSPQGFERLDVVGVDSRTSAYRSKDTTYLRTPLRLLSPAWSSSTSSADGMRVYAINHSPVLLLSENGKMVRARLSARTAELGGVFDE